MASRKFLSGGFTLRSDCCSIHQTLQKSLQSMFALTAAPGCQLPHERPLRAAPSGSLRLCSKGPASTTLAGRSALRRQQQRSSAPRTAAADVAAGKLVIVHLSIVAAALVMCCSTNTRGCSAEDDATQARAAQLVGQVLEAIKDSGERGRPELAVEDSSGGPRASQTPRKRGAAPTSSAVHLADWPRARMSARHPQTAATGSVRPRDSRWMAGCRSWGRLAMHG